MLHTCGRGSPKWTKFVALCTISVGVGKDAQSTMRAQGTTACFTHRFFSPAPTDTAIRCTFFAAIETLVVALTVTCLIGTSSQCWTADASGATWRSHHVLLPVLPGEMREPILLLRPQEISTHVQLAAVCHSWRAIIVRRVSLSVVLPQGRFWWPLFLAVVPPFSLSFRDARRWYR